MTWSVIGVVVFILWFHCLFVMACEYERPKPKWIREMEKRHSEEDIAIMKMRYLRST